MSNVTREALGMATQVGVEKIDWKQIKDWDFKYCVHVEKTAEEYNMFPIERVEGDYMYTPEGDKILDMMSQLICVPSGQCVPEIQDKIVAALKRYGFLWEQFGTDYKAKAARLLVEVMLDGEAWAKGAKVRFCSSGSEATEMAMMIARTVTNKPFIVSRNFAYHGWTMGSAGATANPGLSAGMADSEAEGVVQYPPSHPAGGYFRAPMVNCDDCDVGWTYPACKAVRDNPNGDELPCVLATRRLFQSLTNRVAAIIVESIPGVASASLPPVEYFQQIRKVCDDHGALFIMDEVLAGFGKSGKWFAYQNNGAEPDMITMAKGLVNSAIPTGGVIINKKCADFLESARWFTVGTNCAHPVAMAATVANLEYMISNDAPAKFRKAGEYFRKGLERLQATHKTMGTINGSGMFYNVELFKNKKTRERFIPVDRGATYSGDKSAYPCQIVLEKCLEKGVLLGGFEPNTLRMSCSFNITKADMDLALDALDYALSYLDTLAD
jgi:taurine---2-oxoglutarate transaminase